MSAWVPPPDPVMAPIGAMGCVRAGLRGLLMAVVVFGGLALLLLVRLIERPLCGANRPVTPLITLSVCRLVIRILGIRWATQGQPMTRHGALVANHGSWLDIFTLNAALPIYFVSKSEVANWPGIGWLARATGTVFVERDPKQARAQTLMFRQRLIAGHKLLFFPEGTSTDALRVLRFKTTLFQSFLSDDLKKDIALQPVSVCYRAPDGAEPEYYGWWGTMSFGSHLLKILAAKQQGSVGLLFHDPLDVRDFDDRKTLARACEEKVRAGYEEMRLQTGQGGAEGAVK